MLEQDKLPINQIICGDCLEELKKLPENSIDAIVTDPPYGLEFMGKEWDKFKKGKNIAGGTTGLNTPYGRKRALPSFYQLNKKRFGMAGEEGKNDLKVKKNFKILPRFFNSDLLNYQEFTLKWATECLRVLKPGGYLLSFGGTRTYHRMACAIEDAGFEIRDCLMWVYGSGFPKSLSIGKAVDKLLGNKREPYERPDFVARSNKTKQRKSQVPCGEKGKYTKGNSEWEGWGTALKPAYEPIVVARKPLSEKNVALNVLKWRTGGINIDGCRVVTETIPAKKSGNTALIGGLSGKSGQGGYKTPEHQGRFPANLIHDGSEEVVRLFPYSKSGNRSSKYKIGNENGEMFNHGIYGKYKAKNYDDVPPSEGSAARFFYCAKASREERNRGLEGFPMIDADDIDAQLGKNTAHNICPIHKKINCPCGWKAAPRQNLHPTVKPLTLLRYLCRLVTPPRGIVLDPFIGSGTTAMACKLEGFNYIGIEKEKDYVKIAEARIEATPKPLLLNYEKKILPKVWT